MDTFLSLKVKIIIKKGPQSVSFIERFIFYILVLYLECPLSEVLLFYGLWVV